MLGIKKIAAVAAIGAMMTVSACSTNQVADNTGAAAGFVAKTAVKGTVAVSKAAYNGVKKVAGSE